MCSGSKTKPALSGCNMKSESEKQDGLCCNFSALLELSAANEAVGFKRAVEEEGCDVDEHGLWYGRRMGSKKMRFVERTPLLIASLFGSIDVVKYILKTCRVDVNRACGSDGATALHCAAAGGSASSPEIIKLLLDASADPNALDINGNQPADLIPFSSRRKKVEMMLKGHNSCEDLCVMSDHFSSDSEKNDQLDLSTPRKDGTERKEYPVDPTLPDIKNGIYGTDEFRMYTFKVKPCSRAYSHDWTECPFVHPGENARRRDPRKYHYSCVPCPEFRKGSCKLGDSCEYAHGIFECWLHPAQYRTRLCKDETSCTRRVCFFAHKTEELRPLYASTGSAVPSPRSYSGNGSALDFSSISPLNLGSPSVMLSPTSTPPMTPSGSSPGGGWPSQSNMVLPTLHLPGSRLKSALSARDVELDMELLGLESQRRRQLMEEMSGLASPSSWNASAFTADRTGDFNRLGGVKPTNLEDFFGSIDHTMVPQFQGLSVDVSSPQLQSPKGLHMRNQQLHSSYPNGFSSSPGRNSQSYGLDPSANATAVLCSRLAAFAKRSQSILERSAVNRHGGCSSPASSPTTMASNLSDWGSPDGKVDWGIQGEELNKLRMSASSGFQSNGSSVSMPVNVDEPDVSWVQSLVKDTPSMKYGQLGFEESFEEQQQRCHMNIGSSEMLLAWAEQLYMEQEPMVA